MTETTADDQFDSRNPTGGASAPSVSPPLSKNAQKKLLKRQKYEEKKAERKAFAKEKKQKEAERKRREWEKKLSSVTEEEKTKLIESRKDLRKETMEKRSEEREKKMERLNRAKEVGQKIVVDLEFSHLMNPSELSSLVQQIMYCYAVNGRCASPSHLWLTGCQGEMESQLLKLPGFNKWVIEKEKQSYIEAFQDQKENLVYLTADAETELEEFDLKKIYIIGGLVDRNRWKGLTMKKANEQGIQSAKVPVGTYMKMSNSQVLTVNQVLEILLKYLETKDWQSSFFHVIPRRKRSEAEERETDAEDSERKKICMEASSNDPLESYVETELSHTLYNIRMKRDLLWKAKNSDRELDVNKDSFTRHSINR